MVDIEALRREADAAFVASAGPMLYRELLPELRTLPRAQFVVIAVETGSYEIGSTMSEASERFEKRFGDVLGYVRRIG